MAGGPHPGTTVDRCVIDMIPAAHPHLPGMQPHPHPQSTTGRPHLTFQPKLTHPGRLHRRHRAVKDSKETVTLPTRGDHRPAMPLDHLSQQPIMPLQRHLHRLRLGLPQPGGTLNVGQQECQCPRRQLRAVGLAQAPPPGPAGQGSGSPLPDPEPSPRPTKRSHPASAHAHAPLSRAPVSR